MFALFSAFEPQDMWTLFRHEISCRSSAHNLTLPALVARKTVICFQFMIIMQSMTWADCNDMYEWLVT